MESNLVVKFFEGIAKFLYALLPTILPYSTPLPIAMITASSAETFFGMTPFIAGVFVFSLEGLGVWSTTTFIDKFVEWIRSRNPKVAWMSAIMALVVVAYIAVLILLNVVLKGNNSTAYRWAVTLVCFLPFIAGILNGFRKVDLQDNDMWALRHAEETATKDKERDNKHELAKMRTLAKHGFNPLANDAKEEAATASTRDPKTKHASDYREKAIQFILDFHSKNGRYPEPKQLTERFGLEHGKNKGYMSTLIKNVTNGTRQ
jgi:hypothetical protein